MKTSKQCHGCDCIIEFENSDIKIVEICKPKNNFSFGDNREIFNDIKILDVTIHMINCPICDSDIEICEVKNND